MKLQVNWEDSRIMININKPDKSIPQLGEGKWAKNILRVENGASVNIIQPKR